MRVIVLLDSSPSVNIAKQVNDLVIGILYPYSVPVIGGISTLTLVL